MSNKPFPSRVLSLRPLITFLTVAFGMSVGGNLDAMAQQDPPVSPRLVRPRAVRGERNREESRKIYINSAGRKRGIRVEDDLNPFDKPDEAQRWYVQKRLPAGAKQLPVERYLAARDKIRRMQRFSTVDGKLYPSAAEAPDLVEAPSVTNANPKDAAAANAGGGSTSGVLGTWTNLGPGNIGGRTRALLINPTDPNIMYAAGVAGGVWKSTNGGSTWTPLTDFLVNIAVTTMAFDPANPNIIYAGTGEGFFNTDAVRGAGIFKTTDAGATWTQLAATATSDFYFVQDIVVSNVNSQRIYAATSTGVHRSLDGGATFSMVLASNAANGANGAMDLAIRTDQATDYVFAALGTFATSHIWRNTDAGGAGVWTDVYTETAMGRTSLAIAPSNQNIVYALAAQQGSGTNGSYSDGLLAVFRSSSAGDPATWTATVRNTSTNRQDTLLLSNPIIGVLSNCVLGTSSFLNQGWYDNQIAVDPANPDIVWTAGIDLFRSDNGGVNWGLASNWWFPTTAAEYAHADNHAIVFHPGYDGTTNQTMFVGNDGGVFRTNNARTGNVGYVNGPTPSGGTVTAASPICGTPVANAVAWTALNNGYEVTQFYHGLPYPDGQTFFGGTQDNGTVRGTTVAGTNAWGTIRGGDGGYVAVDPTNTNTIYAENTRLSIQRSTNGGTTWATFTGGITEATGNFLFIAPFIMDPATPQRLYTGGARVWRANAANPTPWTLASQFFNARISALAVAPANLDFALAGTVGAGVFRTTSATTATSSTVWANTLIRSGVVSWVAFDPLNPNVAYATFSSFNSIGNVGHVFKSSDGGATWVLIDGNQVPGNANAIPDIPVHSIIVDPTNTQRLYVGTDLGVFVSLDGGANWARETTGFANTPVESMSINTNNGVTSLFAFTHGRSAFKVTIPSSCADVAPGTVSVGGQAQSGNITVTKKPTASAACDWNAASASPFITVSASSNLNVVDNGTVTFNVTANNTGSLRSGTIVVAGTVVTVNQAANVPTAAGVVVAGRLTNGGGRGIPRAMVTLTDESGAVRTAKTNSSGYYRFLNVAAGASYILTPKARNYGFAPASRVVQVLDSLSDVDFAGDPR